MTTICTDGITLASDTQIMSDDIICSGDVEKIIMNDHGVFALSGNHALFRPLIDWYLSGADPEKNPWRHADKDSQGFAFWAFQDGKLYEVMNASPFASPAFAPDAIGSGWKFAIAALDLGHTPQEGVEAAMKRDSGTGGKIVSMVLPERLQIKQRSDS